MHRLFIPLSLLWALSAQAVPLAPRDFAYGMALQVDGDGALYSLTVPDAVYEKTVRSDLGDIRVFNGLGEVVPHLLQRGGGDRPQQAERITVPFYPLPTQQQSQQEEGEELHIAIGEERAIIDFYGGKLPPQGGAGEYFLIDATALERPVQRLWLEWDEVAEPLLAAVTIEGSDNMSQWHPVVSEAVVAELRQDDYRLGRHDIPLPSQRERYYRLYWPPGGKGVALRRIELELQPSTVPLPRHQLTRAPTGAITDDGSYQFTLPGHFPVDAVQLEMPQRNSVVHARLFSRDSESAAWRLRYQGLFYDLERDGYRLQNEDVTFSSGTDTLWRLEVPQEGGGLGSGVPRLRFGWHPHRLLFVARGEMPFILAFGRAGLDPATAAVDGLLAQLKRANGDGHFIKAAHTESLYELGGRSRLQPAAPPLPWRQWLLWGVLVAGVGVLGFMARALYRQMNGGNRAH